MVDGSCKVGRHLTSALSRSLYSLFLILIIKKSEIVKNFTKSACVPGIEPLKHGP
jgi:hypothetical protein